MFTPKVGTDHRTCWNHLNPGHVAFLVNSRSGFKFDWLLVTLALSGFKPSLTYLVIKIGAYMELLYAFFVKMFCLFLVSSIF